MKFSYALNFNKSNRYANETADVDFSQIHSTQELTLTQVKLVIDAINSNILVFQGEEDNDPLVLYKEEILGIVAEKVEESETIKTLKQSLAESETKVATLLTEIDDLNAKKDTLADDVVALKSENSQLLSSKEALSAQVVDLTEKLTTAKKAKKVD